MWHLEMWESFYLGTEQNKTKHRWKKKPPTFQTVRPSRDTNGNLLKILDIEKSTVASDPFANTNYSDNARL